MRVYGMPSTFLASHPYDIMLTSPPALIGGGRFVVRGSDRPHPRSTRSICGAHGRTWWIVPGQGGGKGVKASPIVAAAAIAGASFPWVYVRRVSALSLWRIRSATVPMSTPCPSSSVAMK